MTDEIKEILERLNKIVPYASVPKELAYMTTNITPQECKTLLDYITTLQEENEKLESILKLREDVITTQHNKIDKAIEYLKLFDRDSDMINHSIIRGLLNILQGDDNK